MHLHCKNPLHFTVRCREVLTPSWQLVDFSWYPGYTEGGSVSCIASWASLMWYRLLGALQRKLGEAI